MDDLYIAVTDALADGGLDVLADLQRALSLVPADMLRTALVARQQADELSRGGVLDARAYVEQGRPVHYWTPIPPGSLIKVTDTPHRGWHEGVTFRVVSGGGYILQTIPQVDDLEGVGLPLSATIDLTKETAEIVRLGPDTAGEGVPADDDDGPQWPPRREPTPADPLDWVWVRGGYAKQKLMWRKEAPASFVEAGK